MVFDRLVSPAPGIAGSRLLLQSFSPHGLTLAQRSTTMRAPPGALRRGAPSPDKPRHMDVYPSRNVDIREHRMPALHNKLMICGDRLRSAGVFLD
jgi:hypothetical protein